MHGCRLTQLQPPRRQRRVVDKALAPSAIAMHSSATLHLHWDSGLPRMWTWTPLTRCFATQAIALPSVPVQSPGEFVAGLFDTQPARDERETNQHLSQAFFRSDLCLAAPGCAHGTWLMAQSGCQDVKASGAACVSRVSWVAGVPRTPQIEKESCTAFRLLSLSLISCSLGVRRTAPGAAALHAPHRLALGWCRALCISAPRHHCFERPYLLHTLQSCATLHHAVVSLRLTYGNRRTKLEL